MIKSYRYRIYPNKEQVTKIEHTFGVCRLVYNIALETKNYAWQAARKNISVYSLIGQLPELKKSFPWIAEVDSQSLNAAILNLDKAFIGFFNGNGFPKFKKKKGAASFQCPFNVRRVDFDRGLLTIPKIPGIPIEISRRFVGKIKTITISRAATGKYFASIMVDNGEGITFKKPTASPTTIGIDVGIKSFVVTSDGRTFAPNRYLKNSLERLKCLQRRASRKKKGSNNRKKANLCVAILHEKITNQRTGYVHQITKQLICDNQAESFVIEDLHVAGMLKNRKLSQAIADVAFGEFFRQMKYKCGWYGKNLIVIDRFAPSSKKCSACGKINDALTLANREWTCECGVKHDRDLNAAKNIKEFGLEKYSRQGMPGEPVESRRIRRAKKQEFKN